ncbi:MAG: GrpE protein [Gemmatimonadota bacterium]|jgi:molecular chaperone GrpE
MTDLHTNDSPESASDAASTPDVMIAADAAADPGAPAIDSVAQELTEQKDKYVRLYAEFENFKRRAVRDRQEAELRGMQHLLRGLLDSLDDLSRFGTVDPATTDAKTVVDGVALVERNVMKSLAGHGLEVVDPQGKPFDPALHEALTTAPAASQEEDGLVAQVYQVGYLLNGTLLRPARVVVQQWNG